MPPRFSQPVVAILERAGWHPDRIVAIAPSVRSLLFPAAERVVAEFSGLHVGKSGPGLECGTCDVNFQLELVIDLLPALEKTAKAVGTHFFPLAEIYCALGNLVIDAEGRTYEWSDELSPLAPTFEKGLEALLLGTNCPTSELKTAWGDSLPQFTSLKVDI